MQVGPPSLTVRRGAAAAELAVVLPLLVFLFVAVVDFGRVYYYALTVTNCARNGALYASDPQHQADSPYTVRDSDGVIDLNASVIQAARAEAPAELREHLTVIPPNPPGGPGVGPVSVTVVYPFNTISRFPGIPDSWQLTRTVTMHYAPLQPSP